MSEAGPARSRVLLTLATALVDPVGPHRIVETVLELLSAVSLAPVSLGVRAPDGVLRTYRVGLPDAVSAGLATLPGSALPGRRVAVDGVARFLDGASLAADHPQAGQVLAGSGFEAAAVLPLRLAEGTVGYLGFHLPAEHRFDTAEQDFLVTVAALVSGALERARLAEQETAARTETDATAARFLHLQSLMARLATAATGSEISEVLAVDGARAMGAQMTTVMVTSADGRALQMAAQVNQTARVVDLFGVVPLDADVPAAIALRSGKPVLVGSRADREARYPFLIDADLTYEATATLPLIAAGRPLGTLTFGWTQPRAFSENDVRLFAAVAEQSAAALERGRLFDAERAALEAAEQAEHRLRLLADVGDAVSASLDPDVVAQRLVDLLVPTLAPHCVLYVQDENRLLRPRASANDPGSRLAHVLTDLSPAHPSGAGPHTRVFRTRRPLLVDALGDDEVSGSGRSLELLGSSVIAAPLVSRGEPLGVLVALRPPGSPFTAADLGQLEQIATRAALALDNALLFTARTRVAAQLQASLLPGELPVVPGLTFAARYRAGDTAAEVGGDFYDVFRLGPDELALVIGDVSGRGVTAAGLTGLARATLRAFPPDFSPAQALSRLNELLLQREDGHNFLTAAYVRLCRTAEGTQVTAALAGHPHPLVVRQGSGQVEKLGRPGLILGVKDSPELHETHTLLRPGDLLLLFTDGVTEAKDASEMFGDARLAATLTRLRDRSPESVVDGIEDAVLSFRDRGADDLALLVVRVDADGAPTDRVLLDHRLPADVTAPTAGRRLVREAVAGIMTGRALQDLELSVNELVTNAVRHLQNDPSRLPRTDPIRLRALLAPGRLRIEVSNPGPGFPVSSTLPDPDAEGGRGLPLVSALSQQMGVETKDGVTLVWFDTEL